MKKFLTLSLALALCAGMLVPASAAKTVLSTQSLRVDGQLVTCEKYNIDGSNYFKLRDLAAALQDTGSQFGVGYDAASNCVTITTHADYIANGSELKAGSDKSSTAVPSAQSIKIDGKAVSGISVYNIGGNNYFKLRDLGEKLGFEVGYDEATRTATVESAFVEKFSYTYDAKGNVLSQTYLYGAAEAQPFTTRYTYDAAGNVLTRSGDGYLITYDYDMYGSCVQEAYTDSEGKYISTYEYVYDDRGNVLTEVDHGYDSESVTRKYTWNDAGEMTSESYIVGAEYTTTNYTYNADGTLKAEVTRFANGDGSDAYYTYAGGLVTYISYGFTDGSSCEYRYGYDKYGNETNYSFSSSDGSAYTRTSEYVYDKSGNPVKEITVDSDLLTVITIRTYDGAGNMLSEKYSQSAG